MGQVRFRTSGSPSTSPEPYHLKRIVLRMYWDGEETPSVETPIGDFFGLGWGLLQLAIRVLSVASRQSAELFLPHAVSETRAHYRHE